MTVIGIDQSYSGFGLAAYDPTGYGTEVSLTKWEPKDYYSDGARLAAIKSWLRGELEGYLPIDCAVMEGYAANARFGREKSGELGAAVKMALYELGIKPLVAQPTALKKFVLGAGKGDKNLMLLGVYKKWGEEFRDDNLADAYACARLAHLIANPELDRLKYEQEVIDAMLKEKAA